MVEKYVQVPHLNYDLGKEHVVFLDAIMASETEDSNESPIIGVVFSQKILDKRVSMQLSMMRANLRSNLVTGESLHQFYLQFIKMNLLRSSQNQL